MQELERLLGVSTTAIIAIPLIAFIAQLIANLTIIIYLPKIKRLCENICYGEEENDENKEKEFVSKFVGWLIATCLMIFIIFLLFKI